MRNDYINVLYVDENQDGTTGGSHYCLLDLVNMIDKNKVNPLVMFYQDNRVTENLRKYNIRVIIYCKPDPINLREAVSDKKLANHPILSRILRGIQILINITRTDIIPLMYFIIFIIKHKIHIIHLNNSVFAGLHWVIAAKVTGRKIVVHQRTHLEKIMPLMSYHHQFIDYVLGVSDHTKEYLLQHGVNLSKYTTLYDRIDLDKFYKRIKKTPEMLREEFSVKRNQPLIGVVGNLQRWKGQITVIEAVNTLKNKYPDLRCLLIGDSSKKTPDDIKFYEELRTMIQEYNLEQNVVITGHRDDIPDILSALDLFIHASTSPEPFGMVILEAMAMRKAIIASNEGGPLEMIIDGESGFLVKPNDPKILAEKIDLVLSDISIRARLGENALQRMQSKFTELNTQYVENLYKRILT